jgi:hypothetical protein
LVAGSGISITANSSTDTITFSSTSAGSIFSTGGDMGTVDEAVTDSEDLGLITAAVTVSYNLGTIGVEGVVTNDSIVDYTITGNKFANNISINTTGNITAGNITVTGEIYNGSGGLYADPAGTAIAMAIALG